MTTGLKASGAAMLLALSVHPSTHQAVEEHGGAAPKPKISSSTFETRALSGTLASEAVALGRREDGPIWAGYAVPEVAGRRRMCCWDSIRTMDSSGGCCGRCSLEKDRGFSVSTNDDANVRLEPSGYFHVLLKIGRKGIAEIRTFSEGCELDAGKRPFIWLTGVDPDQSLDWLAQLAEGAADQDDDMSSSAITAIAMHAGTRADRLLERFASSGHPSGVREQAIFWMGQARGRAGYDVVSRIAREDPSIEIRKKAIFSISQTEVSEAVETLIRFARDDRSAEIREEALFWLAQKAGQRAVKTLTDALQDDPEIEVRKKAVFALSQLPTEEGVPLLIDVARKHRNPEVRKEAIFWLGQSGDPRALELIEEILK